MGTLDHSKADKENNPPPFHLNVNNQQLSSTLPPNYYLYNNNINNPNISIKNPSQNLSMQEKTDKKNNTKGSNKEENLADKDNKKNKKKIINKTQIYNLDEDEEDLSIDIDVINDKKVNVKIPVNKNKIWNKEFKNTDTIGKILEDYKSENGLHLPKNFVNKLTCLNREVNLNDEISTLLPKNIKKNKINKKNEKNNYYF